MAARAKPLADAAATIAAALTLTSLASVVLIIILPCKIKDVRTLAACADGDATPDFVTHRRRSRTRTDRAVTCFAVATLLKTGVGVPLGLGDACPRFAAAGALGGWYMTFVRSRPYMQAGEAGPR